MMNYLGALLIHLVISSRGTHSNIIGNLSTHQIIAPVRSPQANRDVAYLSSIALQLGAF